jgi:hypothetical protein
MGESERGDTAPRRRVSYWCSNGHETAPSFAQEHGSEVPEVWDCPRCGYPAGQDRDNPPVPPRNEPYKTHLAYVKERRSDEDGAAILETALEKHRSKRPVRPAR